MKPLVSILIPALNAEKWIADTLRSAIGQTWSNKEIIVIDDGSRDETLAIARQFESKSTQVLSQINLGASAARNRALSLCQGDYIQWLDADDLLAPDKIALQMRALNECPNERVLSSCAWARFMYRFYKAEFTPDNLWCDMLPAEFLLRKIEQNLFMANAAWLVSRPLTEAAGTWDTKQAVDDDGEYFCRVLLASDRIRFVSQARMYYRMVSSNSRSHVGRSREKLDAQWRSMQLHIQYLRSLEDTGRVRTACVRFLQFNLTRFFPARLDIVAQAEQLTRELGGELTPPRSSAKYSRIAQMLGFDPVDYAQAYARGCKRRLASSWDKTMFRLENGPKRKMRPVSIEASPGTNTDEFADIKTSREFARR